MTLVELHLQRIANPSIKELITKNGVFIKELYKVFSKEKEPSVVLLVFFFEFLSEPQNYAKYVLLLKQLQTNENDRLLTSTISIILGIFSKEEGFKEEEVLEYHKYLCNVYEYYQYEDQYKKDTEELNELINKESKIITNHPQKIAIWRYFNCDPKIECLLDQEILGDLKKWLKYRGFSEMALYLWYWDPYVFDDLNNSTFILNILENQLKDKTKSIKPWIMVLMRKYIWHEPQTEDELIFKDKLRHIFENVLENCSSITDPEYQFLENIFWSALNAKVVEPKHIIKLYSIIHNEADFPLKPWSAFNAENVRISLVKLMQNKRFDISRIAAVSLSKILIFSEQKIIEETWIGEKFWELGKNKDDIWHIKYIKGMEFCRLNWRKNSEEWLRAIKEVDKEDLLNAWCKVIGNAGYSEPEDRDALFNFLLYILESGTRFANSIRSTALRRLYGLISEIEPIGFDDEKLNLPLSRR